VLFDRLAPSVPVAPGPCHERAVRHEAAPVAGTLSLPVLRSGGIVHADEQPREGTAPERRDSLELSWRGARILRPVSLDPVQADVYARWLRIMQGTGVAYAVGGAYAVYAYTGAWRDSKDLDIFLRPEDLKPALDAYAGAGFETEVRDKLWLAKVHHRPLLLDLLFAVRHTTSLRVTEKWFETTRPAKLLGVETRLLGLEEVIATKVYLAARDRFDGADILHLMRAVEGKVDWTRVMDLLHCDEEILLWHWLLYHFVYPGHADHLPVDLMEGAFARAREDWTRTRAERAGGEAGAGLRAGPGEALRGEAGVALRGEPRRRFRGMLLDPEMFAVDINEWGYSDDRDRADLVDHEGEAV
jgi:hypothetical protein